MLRPARNPLQPHPDRWIRAKHENFTTGPLVDKIDAMYEAELIGRGLKEAAHEIRFIGNEMAHGDFVTDIDKEDSADVLGFLEELLVEVYQRNAKLNQFRERRLARANRDVPPRA